jgi:hypothetical protein
VAHVPRLIALKFFVPLPGMKVRNRDFFVSILDFGDSGK